MHRGDDVLTFLRETASERVLVQISRGPHDPLAVPADLLGVETAEPLFEAEPLHASDNVLVLSGAGLAARIWAL